MLPGRPRQLRWRGPANFRLHDQRARRPKAIVVSRVGSDALRTAPCRGAASNRLRPAAASHPPTDRRLSQPETVQGFRVIPLGQPTFEIAVFR